MNQIKLILLLDCALLVKTESTLCDVDVPFVKMTDALKSLSLHHCSADCPTTILTLGTWTWCLSAWFLTTTCHRGKGGWGGRYAPARTGLDSAQGTRRTTCSLPAFPSLPALLWSRDLREAACGWSLVGRVGRLWGPTRSHHQEERGSRDQLWNAV